MEVGGVGGSAAHVDALVKPAETPKLSAPVSDAGLAAAGSDTVATLLEQLLAPQISNLIQSIETSRQALSTEPAGVLVAKAVAAATAGDIPQALSAFAELARGHPARAEALASESALAPIQEHVNDLMQRLNAVAHVDAEQKIASATQLLHTGSRGNAHRMEMHPQSVIAVAERLLESGRYPSVVLSADLAQAVVEYYGPFPAAGISAPPSVKSARKSFGPMKERVGPLETYSRVGHRLLARAGRLWRSAPLLLMLMLWMAMGLVIGVLSLVMRELSASSWITEVFFDVWGIGFLGLIGFGFYRSIRYLRFR